MTLLKPSSPAFMTAEQAAQRHGHASRSELGLRNALEQFCRDRWPNARICHEMVMGARQVRADVVAIDTAWLSAFEVKGAYDDTTRLLHQVGMYQLSVPEVWIVCAKRHADDAKLIHHLMPSVGVIVGTGIERDRWGAKELGVDQVSLEVLHESAPREPAVDMFLEIMWAAELKAMCGRLKVPVGSKATRPAMIKAIRDLAIDELRRECCTELRSRDALWRADAPVPR